MSSKPKPKLKSKSVSVASDHFPLVAEFVWGA